MGDIPQLRRRRGTGESYLLRFAAMAYIARASSDGEPGSIYGRATKQKGGTYCFCFKRLFDWDGAGGGDKRCAITIASATDLLCGRDELAGAVSS
jgi:hypothetical protein